MTAITAPKNQTIIRTVKGYDLHDQLGAGGFGAVYRATQSLVEREVAVKIILPALANQPDFVRRFESEARLVARLEHPHIVPLYDYWRDPDGAYLVMRFLRAGSLQHRLESTPGGRLPDTEIVRIIDQVASALSHAHKSGVVHRDLKPDNIMMDEDGNAYLGDFGLATADDSGVAESGAVKDAEKANQSGISGSPNYISPEQVRGGEITPRTDIYSFGVMTYELFTGKHPFSTRNISELLIQHLNQPLPDLLLERPDLPPALAVTVARATAKNPDDRHADVLQFAGEIRAAFDTSAPADLIGSDDMILIDVAPAVDWESLQNPYKGLRPFEEADAADFFGRDALTAQLIGRLKDGHLLERFLAVVGPSGSGKSSVVKAGVVPSLRYGAVGRSETWFVTEFVPETDPIERLKTALLGVATAWNGQDLNQLLMSTPDGLTRAVDAVLPPTETLLLVIDQFEEAFTLTRDDAIRDQFLRIIQQAVSAPNSRIYVIITLRADFYDKPLLFEGFGNLMKARTEVVLPLSVEELEQAITEPAARVGATVDTNLVAALVNDVAAEPGALPLLQYVLYEVFERRDGLNLTLRAYEESGGALGALARRAEETFATFDAEQQATTRQLFLRLVTLGEGAEDTRRRALLSELLALGKESDKPGSIQAILDVFGKYRLLSFDRDTETREPTVEVAHEALIRKWTRLREWLSGSRNDIRMQRSLAQAAAEWESSGKENSFILTGSRLAQFEGWAAQTDFSLTRAEREYLNASVAQREQEEAAEAERSARELRLAQEGKDAAEKAAKAAQQAAKAERLTATRTRRLLNVIGIVAVITVGLAVLAFAARQEAESQRGIAVANADRAEAAQIEAVAQAATAQNNYNRADALRLAIEGSLLYAQQGSPETIALLGLNSIRRGMTAEGDSVLQNALTLRFPDNVLRTEAQTYAVTMAISPDGTRLLTGHYDGSVQLYDVKNNRLLRRFTISTLPIRTSAFSGDGRWFMVGDVDERIHVYDQTAIETGKESIIIDVDYGVAGILFSPDSKYVLVTTRDFQLVLYDRATGEYVRTFFSNEDYLADSAAWTPDGEQIYFVGSSDRIFIIDFEQTGNDPLDAGSAAFEISSIQSAVGNLNLITLSPDGTQVAAVSMFPMPGVVIFNLPTRALRFQLFGYSDAFIALKYTPDSRYLIGSALDRSIYVWDVDEQLLLTTFKQSDFIWDFVPTADNTRIYTTLQDNNLIYEWNIDRARNPNYFNAHGASILTVNYSRDGKRVLTAAEDGYVYLWDMQTLEQVFAYNAQLDPPDIVLEGAWISPDGSRILIQDTARVFLLNVESAEEIWSVDSVSDETYLLRASFVGDDSRVVIRTNDDLTVYDKDGTQIGEYKSTDEEEASSLFLCDDEQHAIEYYQSRVRVIDAAALKEVADFEIEWDLRQNSCVVNADRTMIAFAVVLERFARVYDLATGREIQRLPYEGDITRLAFLENGKYLLGGGESRSIYLWRTDNWTLTRQLSMSQMSYTFSPMHDSSRLIVGDVAGVVRQYDLDVNVLIDKVCGVLRRDFSPQERSRFEITDPGPTCPVAAVVSAPIVNAPTMSAGTTALATTSPTAIPTTAIPTTAVPTIVLRSP